MENNRIREICEKFQIEGEYIRYNVISNGHINSTYDVEYLRDGEVKRYVLQRINSYVFKNPIEVMNNISHVTEYIRAKIKQVKITAKRDVLHYRTTKEGVYFYQDEVGGFWRLSRFIDDSVVFNQTDNLNIIWEAGKAFGEFQYYLSDYPVEKLFIAIPHFHNTVKRYDAFKNAVSNNISGRAEMCKSEIEDYLELEGIATTMYKMQKQGELPLRVTHNDTKLNNVLFDKDNGKHLAVIDLDTVMPGLAGFDFGDAIRFLANTCCEDEKDCSKVKIDLEKYKAYAQGFLSVVKDSLSEKEKQTLTLGAITMTIECGLRFLTDFIDGDRYFKIDYEDHNLVRSRCQLALGKDMIKNLNKMNDIISDILNGENN